MPTKKPEPEHISEPDEFDFDDAPEKDGDDQKNYPPVHAEERTRGVVDEGGDSGES